MIVDRAIYRAGFREECAGDLAAALDHVRSQGDGFLWIGMHDPTPGEFDVVSRALGLHPLAVEDAAKGHQRPKLDRYDETMFVVLKTATYAGPAESLGRDGAATGLVLGDLHLFVGADFVVTVRHGEGNPLGRVRRRLEADPALLALGPSAVLYAVSDEVVDNYDRIAHEIEADVIELEHRIFSAHATDVTEEIYLRKRDVLQFRTAEDPLIPVLQAIVKGRAEVAAKTVDLFRDVLDHLLRMDRQIDAHNELLTDILSAHLALLGKQQNEDVRRISAYAAMIAVPTMIAGIYGMNFEHMPELAWPVGYPLSIVVMVVAVAVVHRRFKKAGWL